jgi:hypothetical protein
MKRNANLWPSNLPVDGLTRAGLTRAGLTRDQATDNDFGCPGLLWMHRRQAIQAVGGGTLGFWLTGLAEQLARAAENSHTTRPKSLLILWCQGGPSQLETFDPHPGTKIGGDAKGISTSIPGVQIADSMPAMAEQMHRVCLIRSMVSKEGDHERATYHLKTGWRPDPTVVHPSLGSILCYASQSNLEIPRHISILSSQWPARGGYLGSELDAFKTSDPIGSIPNLRSPVTRERLVRRFDLLEMFEQEFQHKRLSELEQKRTLHQSATQRAAVMMDSAQLSAFDISSESQSLQQSFGETPFGRSCLAAVRLLATGVRCVEVELNGWDSHINNHQLQSANASILDKALAATLSELDRRGILDDTIVVCGGEFGRTPQINAAAGRDHWPHGFCMALAGGPFRRGFVYGATDPNPDWKRPEGAGSEETPPVPENPVTVPDLHATLLRALRIDPADIQMTPIGRPLAWSEGKILNELLAEEPS